MKTDWDQADLVDDYARSADDPAKSWYENDVNIPSILRLLGDQPRTVLDFGCGPGKLTERLATTYQAYGADASDLMVQKAQAQYPNIKFFTWDGLQARPQELPAVDAVVSKLTLEFVPDLPALAQALRQTVAPGGSLIISVAHPMLVAHHNPQDNYWEESSYRTQIGSTGVVVTKVQRSFQDYINPFLTNGFQLARIDEPAIPPEVAAQHELKADDTQIPKRLNLLFTAV
jgi:trans-aconitate methyltransferase